MIDFLKLQPIHTSNTPKGRLLKSIPKRIIKSPQKGNPQISFVVKSKNSFSNGKIFNNSFLQESFELTKSSLLRDSIKNSKSKLKQRKFQSKNNQSTTLSLQKQQQFRIKSFSQALMRKKLRSVCYTRREKTKIQLNKCIQSLYLKVQSERISVETPKIQVKHNRQLRPYTKHYQTSIQKQKQ